MAGQNDPTAFDNADAILLFSDGGKGHPVIQSNRLAQIDALSETWCWCCMSSLRR